MGWDNIVIEFRQKEVHFFPFTSRLDCATDAFGRKQCSCHRTSTCSMSFTAFLAFAFSLARSSFHHLFFIFFFAMNASSSWMSILPTSISQLTHTRWDEHGEPEAIRMRGGARYFDLNSFPLKNKPQHCVCGCVRVHVFRCFRMRECFPNKQSTFLEVLWLASEYSSKRSCYTSELRVCCCNGQQCANENISHGRWTECEYLHLCLQFSDSPMNSRFSHRCRARISR